jgi:hypothetical protein
MIAILDIIVRLFNLQFSLPDPELYYRANIETMFASLFIGFIITNIYNPSYIEDNFSLDGGGYNNFCVYIDTAPAKYFVSPLLTIASYFGVRYCITNFERVYNSSLSYCTKCLCFITDFFHLIGMIILPSIVVITPDTEVKLHITIHTSIFLFVIFTNTFQVIFRYSLAWSVSPDQLNKKNVFWLIFYIFFTAGYIGCFILKAIDLQPNKFIFMFFDYSWFFMLFLSSFYFLDLKDDLGEVSTMRTIASTI